PRIHAPRRERCEGPPCRLLRARVAARRGAAPGGVAQRRLGRHRAGSARRVVDEHLHRATRPGRTRHRNPRPARRLPSRSDDSRRLVTHRFAVWAPDTQRLDLVLGSLRTAMTRGEGGWWTAPDVDAAPGARYGFALDGGDTRPDPRSAFQPDGVFGLPAVVDHQVYRWPTLAGPDGRSRGRSSTSCTSARS